MKWSNFCYLAAVVAAHPDSRVDGRTRLQKTMKLLQSAGLRTGYGFRMHCYGPYSEEIFSHIRLLDRLGFVHETEQDLPDGKARYMIAASSHVPVPDIRNFRLKVTLLSQTPLTILELAATLVTLREAGFRRRTALSHLKAKKHEKCSPENLRQASNLIRRLGIASAA